MNLRRRLRSLFRKGKLDAEMAEEMRAHVDLQTERNLKAGMKPEDARYAALRQFGNVAGIQELAREQRGWVWLEQARQDVRYARRTLAKTPGFTAVAIVSLALGIGANTAIFSLVNGILLSSLPVPHPQELRVLQWSGTGAHLSQFTGSMRPAGGATRSTGASSYAGNTSAEKRTIADAFTGPQYRLLREHGAALADVFGYANLYGTTVRARQEAFVAEGLMVSDNFFSGLGVRPEVGRVFGPEEAAAGAAPVVLITHEWWEQQFGLDPAVLGESLSLNGNVFTIIGVLPRGFHGVHPGDGAGFYVPMAAQPQLLAGWPPASPDHWWIKLMARIKPAVSPAQLQAGLDVIFAQGAQGAMKEPSVIVTDGRAGPGWVRDYYRQPLLILLGGVGLVILVACANLAGLSLARGAARQHELSIRAALGSGRWRLIRQSLAESVLLAFAGGGLGLLLAIWGRAVIAQLLTGSPDGLRYDLSLDLTVLGFTLALTLATVLLSGLLPAWRAGQVDPLAGLKSHGALAAPRLRAGKLLVTAQVALSVLLMAVAGLYGQTLLNLVRINPGFATENLLLFKLNPQAAGLRGPAATAFYAQVQERLAAVPGARAVTLMQLKLLAGSMSGGSFFKLPAHPEFTGENHPGASRLAVSETFFQLMGIPVLQGRGLTGADRDGSPKVVVVNEAFVRTFLANENPLGQILKVGKVEWQIAGVCRDAKYNDLKADVRPNVYFSYRQDGQGSVYFAVRTAIPPLTLVNDMRKAVAAINPNVPLADITTQEAVRDSVIATERMFALLVGALAGLAVLLACIGLYGLMAYNVARRTNEIGVRMALGATRRNIFRPIIREALLLAVAGVGVGLPAVFATSRLIASQLYGVAAHDPLSLAVAGVALLVIAALAAWLPARRAAKVDPMEALRAE